MRTSKKSASHTGFIKKMLISMTTIAGLTATIVSVPTVAHADVIQEEECFPAVLMLRGSGEGEIDTNWENQPIEEITYTPENSPNTPFIHTNGHEGRVISKLLQSFVDVTNPSETVSKVRFIGIDYPSAPVPPEILMKTDVNQSTLSLDSLALLITEVQNHIIKYDSSYRAGAQNVVDFIKRDELRGCNTQYTIVGYSQGVIAARLAIQLLGNQNNKIISSYSIGDPFQKINGAISSRQKSQANTSYNTAGIGRGLSELGILKLTELEILTTGQSSSIKESLSAYLEQITQSDDVIYRDDLDNNIVSRTICHENDLVCGPYNSSAEHKIGNFEHHTSYFDSVDNEGELDIKYDVPEFDKQIRRLADSTPINPRERLLSSTIPIKNKPITYNVTNSRNDDFCQWDEDSDGSIDFSGLCSTYTAASGTSRMTVHITDSFDIDYTLQSDKAVVDMEPLDKALRLDPAKWYQFKPYQITDEWKEDHPWDEESCLQYWVSDNVSIDSGSWMNYDLCTELDTNAPAEKSVQVFQSKAYEDTGQLKTKMVWGYDDSYSWSKTADGSLGLQNVSSKDAMNVQPILVLGPDGKAYYAFQAGKECLSSTEDWHVMFELCDSDNIHQLFTATPVEGKFGALSIERDVTPPTKVENVHVTMAKSGTKLQWSPSTDGRTDYVDYHIYQKNESTGDYKLVKTTEFAETEYSLSKLQRNVTYTYKVAAVDYAGNESESDIVTFKLPSAIPSVPTAPTLVSTSYPDKSITMKFKNSGSVTARVMVWKDSTLIAVTAANSPYTDNEAEQDMYSTYTYQLEVSPNVYTAESNDLTVLLEE